MRGNQKKKLRQNSVHDEICIGNDRNQCSLKRKKYKFFLSPSRNPFLQSSIRNYCTIQHFPGFTKAILLNRGFLGFLINQNTCTDFNFSWFVTHGQHVPSVLALRSFTLSALTSWCSANSGTSQNVCALFASYTGFGFTGEYKGGTESTAGA